MRRCEQRVFKTFATAGSAPFKSFSIIRGNAGFNAIGVELGIEAKAQEAKNYGRNFFQEIKVVKNV